MLKKLGIITTLCFSAIGCNSTVDISETIPPAENQANVGAYNQSAPDVSLKKTPDAIIVCRNKQCAPSKLSTSKEYIYNTLLHMFDSNARKKALVCQADANTHSCTEEYVSLPITVGITPAYMYIDDVKIADVSLSPKNTAALDLILNWGVSYNGQTPTCRPSKTLLYVKNINNAVMEDNGYECKMTTIGNSTVKTLFAIDYIDLDYSYIGGFYSIGVSGPAYGGGSGYMVIRLPEDISVDARSFQQIQNKSEAPVAQPIQAPVAQPIQAPVAQPINVSSVAPDNTSAVANKETKEPAPNVDTIIRYNNAAQEYDNKKAKLEKEEQRNQQWETNALNYQGVKVLPIQHKKSAPKEEPVDKNLLNEYQKNNK